MSSIHSNDQMLEMFVFETTQQVEQLEQIMITIEQNNKYSEDNINEIFRIMHTIKGSSAMMMFNNISALAHVIEDLFYFLREYKAAISDLSSLSDLIFSSIDFIKVEMEKIKNCDEANGDSGGLINEIKAFLEFLKKGNKSENYEHLTSREPEKQQYYIPQDKKAIQIGRNTFRAILYFQNGCEMENIRAYAVVHSLSEFATTLIYEPENIVDDENSVAIIREKGFKIYIRTDISRKEMDDFFSTVIFLDHYELEEQQADEAFPVREISVKYPPEPSPVVVPRIGGVEEKEHIESINSHQSIISVNVSKLDKLMDLVGELVIMEAMVTQNPDLNGLKLDNFQKAARQLGKITEEIQDMVMTIRMVPLLATFHRMNRIMRDMCKKLGKEVKLELIGEETEVDKNIIEHISDPLMHLIRNSIDHGIELPEERTKLGKQPIGTITLEAKNSGSDVLIIVKDDGRGLDKSKILKRARENGLLSKAEGDMSNEEIYKLIFLPGFSTKEKVTEFSGRGVGMDVVVSNIEKIGGAVIVDSREGEGSTFILRIPLTLAIIDGMNIKIGRACYTIPTSSIIQSFRPRAQDIINEPSGNKMIMVRGSCLKIISMSEVFNIKTEIKDFTEGIMIMVEQDNKRVCIFADQLLGQQQVVVKSLPEYLKSIKKVKELAGCTLLGDGSISLILDMAGLVNLV